MSIGIGISKKDGIAINRKALTIEQNIALSKKHFVGMVYTGLRMEGRNITFSKTEVILKGINVSDVKIDDICAILGMKRALQEFFKHVLTDELNLDLLKKFNYHIALDEAIESGVLRTGRTGISGTDYEPPMIREDEVLAELAGIFEGNAADELSRALDLFLYLIRKQVFWDGNKRTALLGANYLLTRRGMGVLEIKEKDVLSFAELLTDFFNTGEKRAIKNFLRTNRIWTIDFY
ncbi:MAG TPA: death-on-curing protein [Spirochaetaceae bacterium]|nr:death-on-curing protein [Spirochaetaceae bacterium]